ncbi:hypothetical protein [Catenovulum sediminis]|uniref:Uncharacterized protein n=1 Tax=Catenovulum sediminis TaxID=1740262 RepID=A0ABV1RBN9_9ALTE
MNNIETKLARVAKGLNNAERDIFETYINKRTNEVKENLLYVDDMGEVKRLQGAASELKDLLEILSNPDSFIENE